MRRIIAATALVCVMGIALAQSAAATRDSRPLAIPGGQGTITSNTWRTTGNGSITGNTRQWEYQVSAEYAGSKAVQRLRATWYSGASLKNSASMDVGIGASGITVGISNAWQNGRTHPKYWENTNGARNSSWRSNIVVAPQAFYLNDTIFIANTALVKLASDARTFQINASA